MVCVFLVYAKGWVISAWFHTEVKRWNNQTIQEAIVKLISPSRTEELKLASFDLLSLSATISSQFSSYNSSFHLELSSLTKKIKKNGGKKKSRKGLIDYAECCFGKEENLGVEAWQTHFIRDLVTSSKENITSGQFTTARDPAAWLGHLLPIHSVCLILCILHHILSMVKSYATKKYAECNIGNQKH